MFGTCLCADNGIVVNGPKLQFGKNIVDFAGLTVTSEDVTPSDKMLLAISEFPRPTNLTSTRSWFGLDNQATWAYSLGPIMQPFRDMIKPNQ